MRRLGALATFLFFLALTPAASAGQWAVECGWSHQGQYDAIRAPGEPGASHLHEFFGLRSVRDTLDVPDLKTGFSRAQANTCLLKGDGSAYWAPALYQDGERVQPSSAFAYYSRPNARGKVEPYPLGIEIIGGDMDAKKPQRGIIDWYCDWDSTNAGTPTQPPPCGSVEPRGQPDGSTTRDQLRLKVRFPSCWNGSRELGSVLYPYDGRCPESHNRLLPELNLNVMYPVRYPGRNLSLASGPLISAHADFVNGWDPALQRSLIDRCLHRSRDCGRLSDRDRAAALRPSEPIIAEQVRQLAQAGI